LCFHTMDLQMRETVKTKGT